jgi:tetratricopeptide (TPR) repeat protein
MAQRVRKKGTDAGHRRREPARAIDRQSLFVSLTVCCGLLVAIAIVFGQTLRFDFVNFDDKTYVYQNAQVRKGLSWHGFAWAFSHFSQCNWHPLTWLSHMADYERYQLWPGGHHLTSVLLHVATVLLLYIVLLRMTARRWPSAGVAALFAIHPLHVESVAWVAERKDVLSALFFMLTLAAYVSYVRRAFSVARYLAVVLCFGLGLLAKPMLVTLPFVLLLLDYWPLRRADSTSFRLILLEKVPLLVMAAASSIVTWFAQRGAIKSIDHYPLQERVANAIVSYGGYLMRFVWPTDLTVQYPYVNNLPMWQIAAALLLLAVISAAAIAWRSRCPYFVVGWLWYLGMLVPVIGLVQVGDQAHADRYMYLPMIGPAISIAWAIADFARTSARRRYCCIVSAAVLATLTVTAWRQVDYWRDSESLWTRALNCTSGNWLALHNLGTLHMNSGRTAEAIADFEAALAIKPNLPQTQNSLGLAFAARDDFDAAYTYFQQAIDSDPNDAEIQNNFGLTYAKAGKFRLARGHYEAALRIRPDYPEAHCNLALALQSAGQTEAAIEHLRKALEIWPDDAEACNNLGGILFQSANRDVAKMDEAISYLQRAISIRPDFTQARQNLALVSQARAALLRAQERQAPVRPPRSK